MVRLRIWQWIVLALPLVSIVAFILIAAGSKIHEWGINWIWAMFTLAFVGWRWLLVRWTQPAMRQVEAVVEEVRRELEEGTAQPPAMVGGDCTRRAEAALQEVLSAAQNDRPLWEDWQTFWQRCQQMVVAIAHVYYPEVKYPLLNIYVPQAYGLIRGTVDDMDQWMQKLSPALNQLTVGQAVEAYEVYQRVEPSVRKLMQVWGWAQWVLNPAVAIARQASQRSENQATQQLMVNLNQLLREALLKNLGRQAMSLYSGTVMEDAPLQQATPALPETQTQTLKEILTQAESSQAVEQKPVHLMLVGRTGAGKSSLINTLFQADLAKVDVLPSTDKIQTYEWQIRTGETLTLLDTPGYEQANRADFREQVLDFATDADLLLLASPALDPALQMDADFLKDIYQEVSDLPAIVVVTQVDRLRPIREWSPPYDWQWGNRPKEIAIREATEYRAQQLGEWCDHVLPVVTMDATAGRSGWNVDTLSVALVEAIAPAKQLRLARFLRDRDAKAIAAAKIIDQYTFQMATTQGLVAFLKSPILQFLSTQFTGSPTLARLLEAQIPVEQLPVVIGKLQMTYELYLLLNTGETTRSFDLLTLWPLLLENAAPPDRNAWAFGHALVEYWTRNLTVEQLRERFEGYLR
jgi:predicted GTPase